jgi:biotin carboxyl carrier protein
MSAVRSEVAGSVWKIQVAVGETVAQGDALVILESMKMEIPVEAPKGGTVLEIRVAEGDRVDEGTVVVTLG